MRPIGFSSQTPLKNIICWRINAWCSNVSASF